MTDGWDHSWEMHKAKLNTSCTRFQSRSRAQASCQGTPYPTTNHWNKHPLLVYAMLYISSTIQSVTKDMVLIVDGPPYSQSVSYYLTLHTLCRKQNPLKLRSHLQNIWEISQTEKISPLSSVSKHKLQLAHKLSSHWSVQWSLMTN